MNIHLNLENLRIMREIEHTLLCRAIYDAEIYLNEN